MIIVGSKDIVIGLMDDRTRVWEFRIRQISETDEANEDVRFRTVRFVIGSPEVMIFRRNSIIFLDVHTGALLDEFRSDKDITNVLALSDSKFGIITNEGLTVYDREFSVVYSLNSIKNASGSSPDGSVMTLMARDNGDELDFISSDDGSLISSIPIHAEGILPRPRFSDDGSIVAITQAILDEDIEDERYEVTIRTVNEDTVLFNLWIPDGYYPTQVIISPDGNSMACTCFSHENVHASLMMTVDIRTGNIIEPEIQVAAIEFLNNRTLLITDVNKRLNFYDTTVNAIIEFTEFPEVDPLFFVVCGESGYVLM
jgi:hypothetical protein